MAADLTSIRVDAHPSGRQLTVQVLPASGQVGTHDMILQLGLDPDAEGVSSLDETFINHPAKVAFWATLGARLGYELDQEEHHLARVQAQLYESLARAAKDAGVAATNLDKIVRSQLEQHDDFIRAQAGSTSARYHRDAVAALVKAFDHRRDMLMQLGANVRHEESSQLGVRIVQDHLRNRLPPPPPEPPRAPIVPASAIAALKGKQGAF